MNTVVIQYEEKHSMECECFVYSVLPEKGHTNTHTHTCPFTHTHPYSTPHTHTHIPTHHTPHTHHIPHTPHTPENQPLWNCLSQNRRQIENTLWPTCSSEMNEEEEGGRGRGRRGGGEVGRRQRSGQGEGRKADNLYTTTNHGRLYALANTV